MTLLRSALVCALPVALLAACSGRSGDAGDASLDTSNDAAEDVTPDAGVDGSGPDPDAIDDTAGDGDAGPEGPDDVICRECTTNEQCGDGNYCLNFPNGGQFCGYDCSADPTVCPTGTTCFELDSGLLQCVPEGQVCLDICEGVVCEEGLICDPTQDGACVEPLGYCDECVIDLQCGPDNFCLRYPDADNRAGCAPGCSADPGSCPEGSTCQDIEAGDGGTIAVCVADALTCLDRCEDVVCQDGQLCDPRRGRCEDPPGPCGPCELNSECGGTNLCVGLPGPDCNDDADCGPDEFCGADGTCVGGRCGVDCSDPTVICPTDSACFTLGDGSQQCLPLTLACVDRCSGLECDPDEACDPVSGACVTTRLAACGAPCTDNATCAGPDDVCLNLDGTGAVCMVACDDGVGCPIGYSCFDLFGNLSEFCVPNSFDNTCGVCEGTECATGTTCNPTSGQCLNNPVSCSFEDPTCPPGELCNTFDGRCEPIGIDCDFENRFFGCDFGTMRCTAAREGLDGTCEEACFGAGGCPPERAQCLALHGGIGGVCVTPGIGGADTCGRLAPSAEPVGQPCDTLDDPRDPTACANPLANFCLEGIDPSLPGFCTRECVDDAGCPSGARCESTDQGSFCVPAACNCAGAVDLEPGVIDLLGEALTDEDITRCALQWTIAQRRSVVTLAEAEDPFRLAAFNAAAGEPLRGYGTLDAELDAVGEGSGPSAVPALVAGAAAWGARVTVPAPNVVAGGAAGIVAQFATLSLSEGTPVPTSEQEAALATLPEAALDAAASTLAQIVAAIGVHRSAFVLPGDIAVAVPSELAQTLYAGESTIDLSSAEVINGLTASNTRQQLSSQAVALAATIEAAWADVNVVWEGAPFVFDTPMGVFAIHGSGPDTHRFDAAPPLLLIDLGGDDTYLGRVAAASGSAYPVSIVIDLGGADSYGYSAAPVDTDSDLLPSDGAGRAEPVRGGDGRVTLSGEARQGAGRMGWGLLYDLGEGSDTYTTLRFGQGFGLLGVGVLVDQEGDARLELEALGQGAGLWGLGVVVLGDSGSELRAMHGAQGFGGVGGVGVLVGGLGDDRYTLDAGDLDRDTVIYRDRVGGEPSNLSAGLGAGVGFPSETPFGQSFGGGVGLVVERGGADQYDVGVGALGFGHWHGTGVLRDLNGADTYLARAFAQASAWRFGGGVFVDAAGDDAYGTSTVLPRSSLGAGEDLGWAIFADLGGDDIYWGGAFSMGAGVLNGMGIFADAQGADQYGSESNDTLGVAVLTLVGREPDDNPRRSIGTWGFFVDADGDDDYARPDTLSPRLGDDRGWAQSPAEEAALPVVGHGIDGIGSIGLDR